MADKMRPVPFMNLLERIVGEYRNQKSIFGIAEEDFYKDKGKKKIKVFGQECTTPLGPAAGPHTQLAQNIITSYLVGARFIELKTVQIMDTLEIAKPCIDARDEGYNVEWSTEYTLPKAFDEYLKAWIILHVIETCMHKGKYPGKPSFIFNMSVGYNLEGIKQERMQKYIDSMLNATVDGRFDIYLDQLRSALDNELFMGTPWDGLEGAVKDMLPEIQRKISPSVTISTMHGCPPKEIEAICSYMLTEKKLDTFVKLNPTLLGYDAVRKILDDLGYTYLHLKRESFEHDLQYPDAISMLTRLRALAKENGRGFGVKLTNTLGSVNDQGVLPGEEMYMSGRTLLPISTTVGKLLSTEFNGDLPISYSGGANALTVKDIFETGIHPITVATDMLKPGGYNRLHQMVDILLDADGWKAENIDVEKLTKLSDKAKDPSYYINKDFRGTNNTKVGTPLGLTDCYVAPCVESCPIHQDIPEYIQLMGEGKEAEALAVILDKNALPNITGWICDHNCQNHCTRMDYEGPVEIRAIKRLAAEMGKKEYLKEIWSKPEDPADVKAAVVGAGPAGLSAALFLARAGFQVEIFEKEATAGGVVKNVIPEFRIPSEVVQRDVDFILSHGVKAHFSIKNEDVTVAALKAAGFDYIFYAIGAEKENRIKVDGDGFRIGAIEYLSRLKRGESTELGSDVVVAGCGNTAMDAARAAVRQGAKVTVVYRRSIAEMPADREEYEEAKKDGVTFCFLANPKAFDGGNLIVTKMELGEADSSGRRRPVETSETFSLACSALITATGEKADSDVFKALGVEVDEKGYPEELSEDESVYAIGDGVTGPSTVVRCIASARKAVDDCIDRILDKMAEEDDDECDCGCDHDHEEEHECSCGHHHDEEHECGCGHHHHDHDDEDDEEDEDELDDEALREAENEFFASIRDKKNHICAECVKPCDEKKFIKQEAKRCLECSYLCNKCTEVCPNRANVAIDMRASGLFDNPFQILHLDAYCNECGNCATFCPHDGGPYLKKFTLFSRRDDFDSSENSGFLVEDDKVLIRVDGALKEGTINKEGELEADISEELLSIISEVFISYPYLLNGVEE